VAAAAAAPFVFRPISSDVKDMDLSDSNTVSAAASSAAARSAAVVGAGASAAAFSVGAAAVVRAPSGESKAAASSAAAASSSAFSAVLPERKAGAVESKAAVGASPARNGIPDDQCCKVCMDRRINTVLIRCGHMCVCMDCSNQLDRCPICRSHIDEVIQTYRC
jgi:hypothetical protein